MPFKKGNKYGKGRPGVGEGLASSIRKMLAEKDLEDPKKRDKLTVMVDAMYQKARVGDAKCTEYLTDRGFGKVKTETDITSGGEKFSSQPTAIQLVFSEIASNDDKSQSNT